MHRHVLFTSLSEIIPAFSHFAGLTVGHAHGLNNTLWLLKEPSDIPGPGARPFSGNRFAMPS